MGDKALKILFFVFAIISQTPPSFAQLVQYVSPSLAQLSNSFLSNLLSSSIIPQSNPSILTSNFPPIPLSYGVSNLTPLPAPLPSYVTSFPNPGISIPNLATDCNQQSTTAVDNNVLNNLAIALQLLIVSNLMNAPQDGVPCKGENESVTLLPQQNYVPGPPPTYLPPAPCQVQTAKFVTPPQAQFVSPPQYAGPQAPYAGPQAQYAGPQPQYVAPQPQYATPQPQYQANPAYQPPALKNANFLGSSFDSGASITSFGVPPPKPRSSLALMSPYEAIGPNSPYSDPILSSPYGNIITSKNDFQSPYSLF